MNKIMCKFEIENLVHRVFPPNVVRSIEYTKVSYTVCLKPHVKITADSINFLEMWTHANLKYILDDEIHMIMFPGYDVE